MNILVIGGGVVGQVFQHYVPTARILDYRSPSAVTKKTSSRSYGATYLWRPIPGMTVTRTFPVVTHIDGSPAHPVSVARYKTKVHKAYELGMAGYDWKTQFKEHMEGYECEWPTPRIDFGYRVTTIDMTRQEVYVARVGTIRYDYLISCIPLYALLKMVGWTDPGLQWFPIYIKILTRPPDSPMPDTTMYVNYLSGDTIPYRYTDRDDERHYEALTPMPGKASIHLVPGKIRDHLRASEIVRSLRRYRIWCFGRYAAWSSDELLHETANAILEWRSKHL